MSLLQQFEFHTIIFSSQNQSWIRKKERKKEKFATQKTKQKTQIQLVFVSTHLHCLDVQQLAQEIIDDAGWWGKEKESSSKDSWVREFASLSAHWWALLVNQSWAKARSCCCCYCYCCCCCCCCCCCDLGVAAAAAATVVVAVIWVCASCTLDSHQMVMCCKNGQKRNF